LNTIKSQREFISALESDVDSLLSTLTSVMSSNPHLNIQIPTLKSKKISEYVRQQATAIGHEEIQEMIESETLSRPESSINGLVHSTSLSLSLNDDDDDDNESDIKSFSENRRDDDEKENRQEREADERMNGLESQDMDALKEQIKKLQLEKQDLLELMTDKKREIDELQAELNLKKKELEQESKAKKSDRYGRT